MCRKCIDQSRFGDRDLGFALRRRTPLDSKLRAVTETARPHARRSRRAQRRTIAQLWRDAVAADRPGPPTSSRRGRLARGVVGTMPTSACARTRTGSSRAACGRATTSRCSRATASTGRSSTSRSRRSARWASRCTRRARARDVGYLLAHSEAVAIVCEDATQLAKVEAVSDEPPALQHVLTYHDLDGLAAHGRDFAATNPTALDEATAAIARGRPLHDHLHVRHDRPAEGLHAQPSQLLRDGERRRPDGETYYRPDDVMLLYLPLAHNYGRLMLLLGAHVGFTIAFLADPLRVAEALPQVRPTLLPSVPRVYEKVHTAVLARFDAATGVEATPHRLGAPDRPRGEPARGRRGSPSRPACGASTASPTASSSARCASRSAAACACPDLGWCAAVEGDHRVLRRGGPPHHGGLRPHRVHDGVQHEPARRLPLRLGRAAAARASRSRIADDGEIEVRSETVFQGYYKDPEATAAVLGQDGWLKTGDIGQLDEDGFLHITDRKKDILVTAGGKNVAPQNIENDLKTSKYVSQALVVGDAQPVRRRADHARSRRDRPLGRGAGNRRRRRGARARRARPRAAPGRRRRGEPRALTVRAGEALRDPPARLHDGGTARSRRR